MLIVFSAQGGIGSSEEKAKLFHGWDLQNLQQTVLSNTYYPCRPRISSNNESNIHPVAFAFLPNKKTYLRLFRNILEHVPQWNPGTVTVVFEA